MLEPDTLLAREGAVIAGVDPDVVLFRALQAGLAAATIWTVARLVFLTVLEASTKR